MPQFIHPLDDHILTRDFYYKADLYVGGQHAACDYIRRAGVTRDSRIAAAASGVVVSVAWDDVHGFHVAVQHANGFRSVYRHLIRRPNVVTGESVAQGELIGNVGNTGASQGDHLHFDLWNRGKIRDDAAIFYKNGRYAVDPELYLGKEDGGMAGPTQQEVISNLWSRMAGAEKAIGTLQREITALRAQGTISGGMSEARVKILIRAARLNI